MSIFNCDSMPSFEWKWNQMSISIMSPQWSCESKWIPRFPSHHFAKAPNQWEKSWLMDQNDNWNCAARPVCVVPFPWGQCIKECQGWPRIINGIFREQMSSLFPIKTTLPKFACCHQQLCVCDSLRSRMIQSNREELFPLFNFKIRICVQTVWQHQKKLVTQKAEKTGRQLWHVQKYQSGCWFSVLQ